MHQTGVMPPFQGNDEDRAALSAYLISAHGDTTSARTILDMAKAAELKDSTGAIAEQTADSGGVK